MVSLSFSASQIERLRALGLSNEQTGQHFASAQQRQAAFQQLESAAVRSAKSQLTQLLEHSHASGLTLLAEQLAQALRQAGFSQLATPSIIPALFLQRMGIEPEHPLREQVYWLDAKNCLRPMLAPGLYAQSQQLLAWAPLPLRVFELGSCWRRESSGSQHLSEFTMLNVVEWGTPPDQRQQRLEELFGLVLAAAGISGWRLVSEDSTVYGAGLDAVDAQGLELASSSMGPHPLDAAWRISTSWVGVGFGLERLLLARSGPDTAAGIHSLGRSTSYLDGVSLSVK